MSKLMSLALADLEYHGIPAETQRAKRVADLEAALAAAERIYEELMNEEYGCPTCAAPFDSPNTTCRDSAGCHQRRRLVANAG